MGSECLECGVPKVKINQVIVRGHDALPGSFPWHTAVYHLQRHSDIYACGGTLISSTFVLTADHCVKDDSGYVLTPSTIVVKLGIYNLNNPNLNSLQRHQIFKIHRFFESRPRRNDIALLELKTEAVFNDFVQPACINLEEDVTEKNGMTVGWGFTEDDEKSPTLKAAPMPIIKITTCLEYDRDTFGFALDSSLFCAGHINGTTVCNGDSGGGLHIKRGNAWYVTGIIAYSALEYNNNRIVCRKNGYAAFTNVAVFASWIVKVAGLPQPKGSVKSRKGINPDPARQYKNYLPRTCGIFYVSKIVGGTAANLYEFPWMALLAYKLNNTVEYLCGGSLISKRYVLTSSHCVRTLKPFQVRLGEYDLSKLIDCNPNDVSDCAPPVKDIDIEVRIYHQYYIPSLHSNDIALLRLAQNVEYDDHIFPICLPVAQPLRNQNHSKYIITGFGSVEHGGKKSNILQKATVEANTLDACREAYTNARIDERILCVGNDGRDTCAGDSGGPLGYPVHYNNGVRFVQFGVTSFGSVCGHPPSGYTNVTHFMDWILANMEA